MLIDPEIEAIVKSYEVIKDLDSASKRRVISWLVNKFDLSGELPAMKSGVSRNITQAGPGLSAIELPEDLTGFETAEELYNQIATKTEPEKVLVVAAYLQEKLDLQELGGRRINTELKRMNQGVKNITAAISSLTKKKPALMSQNKKEGASPQAKKKYHVTEEGVKKVNEALPKGRLKL
jgi:hypothetical protein